MPPLTPSLKGGACAVQSVKFWKRGVCLRVRQHTSQMHHSRPKNNVPAYIQRDQWPYLQWLGVTLSEGTLSKMRGIARRNP